MNIFTWFYILATTVEASPVVIDFEVWGSIPFDAVHVYESFCRAGSEGDIIGTVSETTVAVGEPGGIVHTIVGFGLPLDVQVSVVPSFVTVIAGVSGGSVENKIVIQTMIIIPWR